MRNHSNPYEPPEENTIERSHRKWRHLRRATILGAILGVAMPLLNVVRVFAWMWSRAPAPPGTGYSGTPGFVALLAAVIGCPLLGVAFGGIGALIGGVLDVIWQKHDRIEHTSKDT